MTRIKFALGSALFFALSLLAQSSTAQELPTGKVVLEVLGAHNQTNADRAMLYDLAMLERLGLKSIRTSTPWTNGVLEFSGVLMRDLLADAGVASPSVMATALNDYAVTIPVADFMEYDVILATRMNDRVLTIRDRGPVWIIYPWTDKSELESEIYYARSIWQLKSLIAEPN